jgi:NAD(P)-dependent dehydrogenase (short-subunit alcohol dehydrogenase family)
MASHSPSDREVIVITGASGGIGRAAALAFAHPGARIALLARGERGLQSAKREVENAGAEALVIPTDVADCEQVERAAARIEQQWGGIDVWVNNAMATVFAPIADLSPADLRRATEVTYLGAAYGTMAALKRMRPRNCGVIVQVGSALSYRAIPLQSAYCAAKFALRGFTDSLRSELLHDRSRVHVTMVHLSAFNTPQFDWARNLVGRRAQPVPPIFQPELAAEAIVWAARHRRREVYVGWPALKAVAANKVAPGVLDRVLADGGYSGQITDEPLPADACENLYQSCDVDAGAHGRFDALASTRSWQWEFTKHRAALLIGAAALLGGIAALGTMRRRSLVPSPDVQERERRGAHGRARETSSERVRVSERDSAPPARNPYPDRVRPLP